MGKMEEATMGGAGMGAHMQLGSAFMRRPSSMIPYNQWAETDDDDLSAVASGPAISAFQPFSVRDMLRLDDVEQDGEPIDEAADPEKIWAKVQELRKKYPTKTLVALQKMAERALRHEGVEGASSLREGKTRAQRKKENKARFAKMSPEQKAATKGDEPFHPEAGKSEDEDLDESRDSYGQAPSLGEIFTAKNAARAGDFLAKWMKKPKPKTKGKKQEDEELVEAFDATKFAKGLAMHMMSGSMKGKLPSSKVIWLSSVAAAFVKKNEAKIRKQLETGSLDPKAFMASFKKYAENAAKKSEEAPVSADVTGASALREGSKWQGAMSAHEKRVSAKTSTMSDIKAVKKGAPKSAADLKHYAESVCATVLREARPNPKTHPKMKAHVNSPKFRAHIGDPKDQEKPYHKGKGIQSDEAPVGAGVLREGGKEKWIAGAIKRPGALKAKIEKRTKKGTIPAAELAKAAKKPGLTGQQARLAKTLRKIGKK